jgi:hypothetical protein
MASWRENGPIYAASLCILSVVCGATLFGLLQLSEAVQRDGGLGTEPYYVLGVVFLPVVTWCAAFACSVFIFFLGICGLVRKRTIEGAMLSVCPAGFTVGTLLFMLWVVVGVRVVARNFWLLNSINIDGAESLEDILQTKSETGDFALAFSWKEGQPLALDLDRMTFVSDFGLTVGVCVAPVVLRTERARASTNSSVGATLAFCWFSFERPPGKWNGTTLCESHCFGDPEKYGDSTVAEVKSEFGKLSSGCKNYAFRWERDAVAVLSVATDNPLFRIRDCRSDSLQEEAPDIIRELGEQAMRNWTSEYNQDNKTKIFDDLGWGMVMWVPEGPYIGSLNYVEYFLDLTAVWVVVSVCIAIVACGFLCGMAPWLAISKEETHADVQLPRIRDRTAEGGSSPAPVEPKAEPSTSSELENAASNSESEVSSSAGSSTASLSSSDEDDVSSDTEESTSESSYVRPTVYPR